MSVSNLPFLEEVFTLVVNDDECGEIYHVYLPDGFHAELRVLQYFYIFNVILCENSCRSTDRTEVEASILLAGLGDHFAAVTLSEGDETASSSHERVDVRVHTSSGSRAERARRHTFRSLGGTSVVNNMISEVLGHGLSSIESFLNLGVGDITSDNNCTS